MRFLVIKNFFLVLFFLPFLNTIAQGDARQKYINDYYQIAIREMQSYGIPASITMAQGILESASGLAYLSTEANNHFGIKCHDWTGPSVRRDDDKKDECFRKYTHPMLSYEDHSKFLSTRSRYAFLFDLDKTDYVGWAKGLKKAGYATDPKYPAKLIKIIEENELFLLDEYALAENPDDGELPAAVIPRAMDLAVSTNVTDDAAAVVEKKTPELKELKGEAQVSKGGLRFVISQGDRSYIALAKAYDLHVWEIYRYNDLRSDDKLTPEKGERVYLQHKTRKYYDNTAHHKVQEGETMYELAQRYGIRVKSLYRINDMFRGTQPQAGALVYLHRKARPKQSMRR